MLKKKILYTKYVFTFIKNFSLGLSYLGTQIRCAKNRYTVVQAGLKYPLIFCKTSCFILQKLIEQNSGPSHMKTAGAFRLHA